MWRSKCSEEFFHRTIEVLRENNISIYLFPFSFDIGPVLMQRRFPVPPRCTSLQLSHILAPIGADMVGQPTPLFYFGYYMSVFA